MTNTEYRCLFIQKLSQLVVAASARGIRVMPYFYHRTAEQQNALYQKGRTAPGDIVTYCDGYTRKSKHQTWRAADLVIVNPDNSLNWHDAGLYAILGSIWKSLGGRWGGDFSFRDYGHFEV